MTVLLEYCYGKGRLSCGWQEVSNTGTIAVLAKNNHSVGILPIAWCGQQSSHISPRLSQTVLEYATTLGYALESVVINEPFSRRKTSNSSAVLMAVLEQAPRIWVSIW